MRSEVDDLRYAVITKIVHETVYAGVYIIWAYAGDVLQVGRLHAGRTYRCGGVCIAVSVLYGHGEGRRRQ